MCYSCPHIQDHHTDWNKCLFALSLGQILIFSFSLFFWWHCAESCSTFLTTLMAKCVQVLSWPVSSSVCLRRPCVLLVDLCWEIRILSHRSKVQTMLCLHQYSSNTRWSPLVEQECSNSFVSSSAFRGVGNRFLEQRLCVWSNTIPWNVICHNTQNILSSFDIWIWIFGFFSFWRIVLRVPRGVAGRFARSGGWRLSFLPDFARPAWKYKCIVLRSSASHQKFTSPTSPALRAYPMNIPKRLCRTDALHFGLLKILDTIYICSKMEWQAHQMVNRTDVHEASGHLPVGLAHFGESSNTPCMASAHRLSCSPDKNQYWRSSFVHSSHRSLCNSICFRSVLRWFLMIPIQLFASLDKFQRIVWSFAGGYVCWRRLSNLKIPLLVLPWMFEATLVILFPRVPHGSPQLVSASSHPQLWSGGRLLSRLWQPRMWLSVSTLGSRWYEQQFSSQTSQRKYRGWFFQQLNLTKHVQITDMHCCSSLSGSRVCWTWDILCNLPMFCSRTKSAPLGPKSQAPRIMQLQRQWGGGEGPSARRGRERLSGSLFGSGRKRTGTWRARCVELFSASSWMDRRVVAPTTSSLVRSWPHFSVRPLSSRRTTTSGDSTHGWRLSRWNMRMVVIIRWHLMALPLMMFTPAPIGFWQSNSFSWWWGCSLGDWVGAGLASAMMVALGHSGEIQDNLLVCWFVWPLAMVPFSFVVSQLSVGFFEATSKQASSTAAALDSSAPRPWSLGSFGH